MEESLRVLWVTPWYPDTDHPYRSAYIQAQFRATQRQGAQVQLLFVDISRGKGIWHSSWEVLEPGVFRWKIRSVGWKIIAHIPRILAFLAARLAFKKLPEIRSPHILHGNIGFPGGPFASVLARTWSIPFVLTEHWTKAMDRLSHPVYGKSMQRAYLSAARVLPVSDFLAAEMNKKGIVHTTVIPNVMEFSHFSHRNKAPNSVRERKGTPVWHWLSVASLITSKAEVKKVEWILNALGWYQRNRPEIQIHWTHIGEGGRLPSLQNRAKQLNVEHSISWAGGLPLEKIGQWMRESDLFLHPTRLETFGLVVREALATGLPVVTTNIPVHQGWWKPVFGVCTDLNEDSFLQGIQTMENRRDAVPEDAFGREAFTSEAVGKDLLEIYRSLLAPKAH
jgi:glycosyltransferase involved in cell wall biosynthesis